MYRVMDKIELDLKRKTLSEKFYLSVAIIAKMIYSIKVFG